MTRYVFLSMDEHRSSEVKVTAETWYELADEFVFFLQGAGFVVDHATVAEYFAEYLEVTRANTTDGCDDQCTGCHEDVNLDVNDYDFANSAMLTPDFNISDITIDGREFK